MVDSDYRGCKGDAELYAIDDGKTTSKAECQSNRRVYTKSEKVRQGFCERNARSIWAREKRGRGMTIRDITIPGHRRMSDKTLLSMKKSELIEYIRVLEHNWSVAIDWNEQQARNFADMLHNITQIGGDDE